MIGALAPRPVENRLSREARVAERHAELLRCLASARSSSRRERIERGPGGEAHDAPIGASELRQLCQTAGELVALGGALPALDETLHAALIDSARQGLDLGTLEDEAYLLVDVLDAAESDASLDDATDDPRHAEHAREELVAQLLTSRDTAQHRVDGLAALTGRDLLTDDDALALATFDAIVRPALPRLTRYNHLRAAADVVPSARDRYYWRFLGSSIAPGAWDAMSHVAALLAQFPEVEAQLRALVLTERAVASAR